MIGVFDHADQSQHSTLKIRWLDSIVCPHDEGRGSRGNGVTTGSGSGRVTCAIVSPLDTYSFSNCSAAITAKSRPVFLGSHKNNSAQCPCPAAGPWPPPAKLSSGIFSEILRQLYLLVLTPCFGNGLSRG